MPGSTTSRSTRSKRDSRARRRPSAPFPAVSTSTGPSSSMLRTSSRMTGSSSTTRIRNGERESTREASNRSTTSPTHPSATSAQGRDSRRICPTFQAVGQPNADEIPRAVEHPELHPRVQLERNLAPRFRNLVHRQGAGQHHPLLHRLLAIEVGGEHCSRRSAQQQRRGRAPQQPPSPPPQKESRCKEQESKGPQPGE